MRSTLEHDLCGLWRLWCWAIFFFQSTFSNGGQETLVCFPNPLPASSMIWIWIHRKLLCIRASAKHQNADSASYVPRFCPSADPEGRGLGALRGHGHPLPESRGRDVGAALALQRQPAGRHGAGARGAADWLVQPLRPPPLLRRDGGQLGGHADEHDPNQGETFQGSFLCFCFLSGVM